MRWAVEIQKTGLEKRNLSDLLVGLRFELVEGIDHPALTSPEIDACDSAAKVFEKAKAVRAALKWATQIDPEFILGSVIDYSCNPPQRHAFLEAEACVQTNSFGKAIVSISPPKGLSPSELARWRADYEEQQYQTKLEHQRSKLEPAFFNERAAKLIELLAIDNPPAVTIYKIYELAEGHPNKRAEFHRQFGISSEQFNRFKDTIHNPSVTGDWARHAYHEAPKTSNPMSKDEAEVFVRSIAAKWLKTLRPADSQA